MKESRRELPIDIIIHRDTFKNNMPKTEVRFYCVEQDDLDQF